MENAMNEVEGVWLKTPPHLDCYDSKNHQFQYFMDTTETMWESECIYYYRITCNFLETNRSETILKLNPVGTNQ